jgi:hypothetical protein
LYRQINIPPHVHHFFFFFIGKLNELEYKFPGVETLMVVADEEFPLEVVRRMEVIILETLGWQVSELNLMSFIDYYVEEAVKADDYRRGTPVGDAADKAMQFVRKYVKYFLSVGIQGRWHMHTQNTNQFAYPYTCSLLVYNFRMHTPSSVAASIVAATRFCLHLAPIWPRRLEERTGYQYAEIRPCIGKLIRYVNLVPSQAMVVIPPISVYSICQRDKTACQTRAAAEEARDTMAAEVKER